jgi:hypothetical protein
MVLGSPSTLQMSRDQSPMWNMQPFSPRAPHSAA